MTASRWARIAAPAWVPAPEALELFDDHLRVGDGYVLVLKVMGYPKEVEPGWLRPLIGHPAVADLTLHIDLEPPDEAVAHLRRQHGRMESTRQVEAAGGTLPHAEVEGSADDAALLAARVGRRETRTFRVALYICVRAGDPGALQAGAAEVEALARGLLLDPRRTTFRPKAAWLSTLPLGLDLLGCSWRFDTTSLAYALPFATAEVEDDRRGSPVGLNMATGSPVLLDRFALTDDRPNAHQLILAQSGAGKSYAAKLGVLASLYRGVEVMVVDLENEYLRLAEAVGGTVVRLGPDGDRVNPLDLAEAGSAGAVTEQALFVGSLVATLTGALDAAERAALDRAVLATYRLAGITADPATHTRPAPLLADVVAALRSPAAELDSGAASSRSVAPLHEAAGRHLAARLEPWVTGAYRGLFSGPTTVRPEGQLVVFALGGLPEEDEQAVAAGMLLATQAIWRRVFRGERRPREIVLEELWRPLRAGDEPGRHLLRLALRLVKGARKFWCGITGVTQDVAELLSTQVGQALLSNSSTKLLLRQSPQSLRSLGDALDLTPGQRRFLMTCGRGEGLLAFGSRRARLRITASAAEHPLCTSDPAELARLEEAAG